MTFLDRYFHPTVEGSLESPLPAVVVSERLHQALWSLNHPTNYEGTVGPEFFAYREQTPTGRGARYRVEGRIIPAEHGCTIFYLAEECDWPGQDLFSIAACLMGLAVTLHAVYYFLQNWRFHPSAWVGMIFLLNPLLRRFSLIAGAPLAFLKKHAEVEA